MMKYYALATAAFFTPALSSFAQPQNALDFDGMDDQVIVSGASAHIAGSAAFSMTAWVYPRNSVSAFPDLDGYVGFRNEVDADFYLVQIYGDVLEGRFRNSGGTAFTATTPNPVGLNAWHHVGLIYDGAALAIWIDGDQVASVTASGTITNTGADFTIGNINYNTQPFWLDGKMDEIALWRRALNAQEMDCLSAMPPNSGDPDLAFYYGCDQGTIDGDNTAITALTDNTGTIDGTLSGFALTGSTSNFVQGTVFGTQVSDVMCPGGTYLFNGQTLTAPGVYTASFSTGGLCDSTVVLTLTETAVNTSVAQNQNLLISQASGAGYQWINCATNQPIGGATGQFYTAFNVGQYAVIVTQNGCSDTSACYNVTTIGIEERQMPTAKIWPTVTSDQLNVEMSAPVQRADVRVVDMTGRTVLRRSVPLLLKTTLDVTTLVPGAYFLELGNSEGSRAMRFVRE